MNWKHSKLYPTDEWRPVIWPDKKWSEVKGRVVNKSFLSSPIHTHFPLTSFIQGYECIFMNEYMFFSFADLCFKQSPSFNVM